MMHIPFRFLLLLTAASAFAHAILLDSTPKANEAIASGHLAVQLHFNSRVDGKRSKLMLISIDKQSPVVLKDQSEPDKLAAEVDDLKTGSYRLIWQVLAADGHLTRGQIPFKVK